MSGVSCLRRFGTLSRGINIRGVEKLAGDGFLHREGYWPAESRFIWMIVEILVVGYQSEPPLQVIFGSVGMAILILGWWESREPSVD